MHKYFTGDVKKMTIKKIEVYEGIITFSMKKITIKKNVLLYKGKFSKQIIDFSSKYPLADEKNAIEHLTSKLIYQNVESEEASCLFTSYENLIPYPITKQEEKKLIKERKKDKNII